MSKRRVVSIRSARPRKGRSPPLISHTQREIMRNGGKKYLAANEFGYFIHPQLGVPLPRRREVRRRQGTSMHNFLLRLVHAEQVSGLPRVLQLSTRYPQRLSISITNQPDHFSASYLPRTAKQNNKHILGII